MFAFGVALTACTTDPLAGEVMIGDRPASGSPASDDFTPWQQCAARLMGYDGPLWDVAYYPHKHPDGLGLAMIDAEGYASVWAPAEKPWVQLHEACHVVQFARGEDLPGGRHSPQEVECRVVQEHWREC